MIYVIVFVGAPPDDEEGVIVDVADAYLRTRRGTWLVSSELSAVEIREYLNELEERALVVRASPEWATTAGVAPVTRWLRSAHGHF